MIKPSTTTCEEALLCEVCGSEQFSRVLDLPIGSNESCTYWECDSCQLVRLETPTLFDYADPDYVARLTRQALSGERLWNWTLDRIEERCAPGRLVEVGAGVGTQLSVAKSRGWNVLGYDINPDCTEVAKRLHQVEVRCENFLTLEEESFADVVLMNQLIEHVPDPVPFLRASRRALRPGGILVMSTPNWNFARPLAWVSQHGGVPMPYIDHIKPTQHIRLYCPNTMKKLAAKEGWELVDVRDNPTDLLGHRSRLSARRLIGEASRALSRFSGNRVQFGLNMTVFFETP